jgi:hypothetical protein
MRIDMVYYPTDFFAEPPSDVDVEASGRTFVALLSDALVREFPGARINVWYSPTEVKSEEEFEIHWSEGEIDDSTREGNEREIRDRVATVAGELRESRDWIVRRLL